MQHLLATEVHDQSMHPSLTPASSLSWSSSTSQAQAGHQVRERDHPRQPPGQLALANTHVSQPFSQPATHVVPLFCVLQCPLCPCVGPAKSPKTIERKHACMHACETVA